jgi:acetamidase/formamidase
VSVKGATPGDALQIDILELRPADWGYTSVEPGFGLLADEFPGPHFRSWDLSSGRTARLGDIAEIPIEPFLGALGVAQPPPLELPSIPPNLGGGNLDIKHLTVGSQLWLPVAVDGALLSVGDMHAAQGDGEVCGSALETFGWATVRVGLRKGMEISAPQVRTRVLLSGVQRGPWHGTLGIGPDLRHAAKDAVRAMITFIERGWRLDAADAYILCSLCLDLKINEIVDTPNWVVSAFLPLDIFKESERVCERILPGE